MLTYAFLNTAEVCWKGQMSYLQPLQGFEIQASYQTYVWAKEIYDEVLFESYNLRQKQKENRRPFHDEQNSCQ